MTSGLRADAGVVISASHNPYDDNGIKFFGADGFKLPDSVEAQIEALVESETVEARRAFGSEIGRAYRIEDAWGRYCICQSRPSQGTSRYRVSRSSWTAPMERLPSRARCSGAGR